MQENKLGDGSKALSRHEVVLRRTVGFSSEGREGASAVVGGVPEPDVSPEGLQEVLREVEVPLPTAHVVHRLQTAGPKPASEAVAGPPLLGQVEVVVEAVFRVEEGEPAVVHPLLGPLDGHVVGDKLGGGFSHGESSLGLPDEANDLLFPRPSAGARMPRLPISRVLIGRWSRPPAASNTNRTDN